MFANSALKTVLRKPLSSLLLTALLSATAVLLCLSLALSAATDVICQNLDGFYTTVATMTPAPNIADYGKSEAERAQYYEEKQRYTQLGKALIHGETVFEHAQLIDRRWRMAALVEGGQPVTVGMQGAYIYNEIFDSPNNMAVLVLEKTRERSEANPAMPRAAEYRVTEVIAAHESYSPQGTVEIGNGNIGGGDLNINKWEVGEKYLVLCEFDDHSMDSEGRKNKVNLCYTASDVPSGEDPSTLYTAQNAKYGMVDGVWSVISADYIPVVTHLDTDLESFWETEAGQHWRERTIAWVEQSMATFWLVGSDQVKSQMYFVSGKAHLAEGRYITDAEYEEGAAVCMISAPVAEANGWTVGDVLHVDAYPSSTLGHTEPVGIGTMSVSYLSHSLPYRAEKQAELDLTVVGIYRTEVAVIDDEYYIYPNTIMMPKQCLSYDTYPTHVVDCISVIIANRDLQAFKAEAEELGYGEFFTYRDQGYGAIADMLLAVQASSGTIRNMCLALWVFSLALVVFLFFLMQRKIAKTMHQLGCRARNIFVYVLTQLGVMGILAALVGFFGSVTLYDEVLSRMLRGELPLFDSSFSALSTGEGTVEEVMGYLTQSPETFAAIIGIQFALIAVVFVLTSTVFARRRYTGRA